MEIIVLPCDTTALPQSICVMSTLHYTPFMISPCVCMRVVWRSDGVLRSAKQQHDYATGQEIVHWNS